jgi:L-galactose dehydrogenase
MKKRAVGKTGFMATILGFGGSPLGGVFGFGPKHVGKNAAQLQEVCNGIVQRAVVHHGINYLDTSPYYGGTVAETRLGHALKSIFEAGEVKREDLFIATKIGRYHVNHPTSLIQGKAPNQWAADSIFDFSRETVIESVEESLKRLQVDYLDLVQCHDIEYCDDLRDVTHEAVPALAELRKAGLIKAIGLSAYPLNVLKYALDQIFYLPLDQQVDTVLSYCHYTLCNKGLESSGLLERWKAGKDKGVINAAPLAMGLLTKDGPPDWHPASKAIKHACRTAAAIAEEMGVDIADVAIEYALRNPSITTTLIGFKSEEEVDQAVNVATIYSQRQAFLPLADISKIRKPLHNIQDMDWKSGNPAFRNI